MSGWASTKLQRLWGRLGVRLAAFLSVALIPVGLLGVIQTQELIQRTNAQAEARLSDRTRAAAGEVRETILWALGAASGLGQMAISAGTNSMECHGQLAQFVSDHDEVTAVGFIGLDGWMSCSSTNHRIDFSRWAGWADIVDDPRPLVEYNPKAPVSGGPTIIAMMPVVRDDVLRGFLFVSQPHVHLDPPETALADAQFMTFNADGDILTSTVEPDKQSALLPADRSLQEMSPATEGTFTAYGRDGTVRVYSVIPIIDNTVYAIGIWPRGTLGIGILGLPMGLPLFPLLMWLTSLTVAYIAVHRLVVRHIRTLARHMRAFARNRRLSPQSEPEMAREIAEIYDTFNGATETILRDEAELEALLQEKNVLLKEVHHRVKNNLQLISSIMNMQMRKVRTVEARNTIKRLQSRVLSLATIHRNLYQTSNLSAVEAGGLLEQLVSQLAALLEGGRRVRIETSFDPVVLYPDQAVPVSLLTVEGVTNALKYLGAAPGETPKLCVSLVAEGDNRAHLIVENTKGPVRPGQTDPDEPDESTGLGQGLMQAFASQLGTELEMKDTPERFRLSCRFVLQGFVEHDAPPAKVA